MKKTLLFLCAMGFIAAAQAGVLKVDVEVSTAIVNRDPSGVSAIFTPDIPQLAGWCRVKGASEPIEIYHVWRRDGKEEVRVKLPVRSSNYRVWSYCAPKGRKGAWTLDVLDWDGNVLATKNFEIR